ncbi:hypothetical protein B0A48_02660 [Cryoendolithus antarcticus]|uniref:Inosine/uridine-preferring nucleoside hydrolase domain-containing protein n=1 Tax=Cryoendolithus antarcticus TaxID=1507870 RepID=A0A1V8TL88_9PEZI|nr:hypothetical protein B0A48_02660 [Cryoendolithus antarcticus]
MAPRKVIIDTDPGCDDTLAMLLAFAASPQDLEVLMVSATYGNVELESCLRNVVSLFYHIEKEIEWRKANGRKVGFETLLKTKPIVSVGPEHPLSDTKLMADYFHGTDGLGGISDSHPHLSPADTWKELFDITKAPKDPEIDELRKELESPALFTPSQVPAHLEILRLLRENEPNTITIVAVGPLTNLAIAAAEDPETFLRVKEVVVMGGNIYEVGNVTPVAEFNTFADTVAAARVYALTSPSPHSTMPPVPPTPAGQKADQAPPPYLQPYPGTLSKQLNVTLFPLDITQQHEISRGEFQSFTAPLITAGSPLAEWVSAWLNSTFRKVESLQDDVSGDAVGLHLHDPMTIWYCITQLDPKWELVRDEDIRVETSGQWTRGMCVIDRRSRRKREVDLEEEISSDHGAWLSAKAGNRLSRCVGSPGTGIFGTYLLEKIFAS